MKPFVCQVFLSMMVMMTISSVSADPIRKDLAPNASLIGNVDEVIHKLSKLESQDFGTDSLDVQEIARLESKVDEITSKILKNNNNKFITGLQYLRRAYCAVLNTTLFGCEVWTDQAYLIVPELNNQRFQANVSIPVKFVLEPIWDYESQMTVTKIKEIVINKPLILPLDWKAYEVHPYGFPDYLYEVFLYPKQPVQNVLEKLKETKWEVESILGV